MSLSLGPVSAVLERDLRNWVRGHGIVMFLDGKSLYSGFVNQLSALRAADRLPYEVKSYRHSFLELLLELEPLTGGLEKPAVVLHLPGFVEGMVADSPLFELYESGARYRKALDTLVTEAASGQVRPELLESFLQQESVLTLEGADAWLAALLDERSGGLAADLLGRSLPTVMDELLVGGDLARRAVHPVDQQVFWVQFGVWTGLTSAWRDAALPVGAKHSADMAFVVASWALAVEYAHDLKRPPVDPRLQAFTRLPGPLVESCRKLATHLREQHSAFYQRTADETEGWLEEEVEAAKAEDLGRIDTFRFEDQKLLQAALEALLQGHWAAARLWAQERLGGGSLWLREQPALFSTWELIAAGAVLGEALTQATPALSGARDLGEAVTRYRELGAGVDRHHRHLEQRRLTLLQPQLVEFQTLRLGLNLLRQRWRQWADDWAREFNACCKSHGFLPEASLQQRTIFEDVVRPLTRQSGVTALFLVDGLRYEMGEELFQTFEAQARTQARIEARLAELPTVTEVGMGVLAPVAERGRLRPVISGGKIEAFLSGELRVSDPESRRRAMHDRVGGDTCPWLTLEEAVSRKVSSLKQAASRARLLVIHSREIDIGGESGLGPAVFDTVLKKLEAAWRLLREAGVQRFVITADHGFLLLDDTTQAAQAHGRKSDPKRRHVLTTLAGQTPGEVAVALTELGYVGVEEQLVMPETTAIFDTGSHPSPFVHGGNSLQERVIPVITVHHRGAEGGAAEKYQVTALRREDVAGMQCIEAKVEIVQQQALSFSAARTLELALRVPEAREVQVELCQVRGAAKLVAGAVEAQVGAPFEVFFRLLAASEARVEVEIYQPAAEGEQESVRIAERFNVDARRSPVVPPPTAPGGSAALEGSADGDAGLSWLDSFPNPGERRVFAHLARHEHVNEQDAAHLLGSARALRQFSLHFEQLVAKAPFRVRIETVDGLKHYVRERSSE